MTPLLIVPDGWRFSSHDNFVKGETVYRIFNTALQRGFDFALQQDHIIMQTERERVEELQKWIWMVTGETPPTPNPAWQTPAVKAAIAMVIEKAANTTVIGQPPPPKPMWANSAEWKVIQQIGEKNAEPTLPPGITRLIELE